jgi:hypothetical protein
MRISEVKDQQTKVEQVRKFADWAMKELNIKTPPTINYGNDLGHVMKNRSFGSTHSNGDVWVHIGNRNVADCCRTLVHELIHVKQFQIGSASNTMDDEQRQNIEDVANALAGRMLRTYGKRDSSIYESKQSKPCCVELKKALLKNKKTDYDSIDKMMKRIAKNHDITPKELHDFWVADYKMSPDDWIKQELGKKDTTESIIDEALSQYGIRGVHRVQSTR